MRPELQAQTQKMFNEVYHPHFSLEKDTLPLFGVRIPLEWAIAIDYMVPQDFGDIDNLEVRTALLRYYCNKHYDGQISEFIRHGGGRVVLSGNAEDGDYQYGEILEFIWNGESMYFLKLINRTVEPGSEKLLEDQRLKQGLTKDGFKVYLLGIPVDKYKSVRDAVAWTFGAEKNKKGDFVFKYPSVVDIGNGQVIRVQQEAGAKEVTMGHQGDVFLVRVGNASITKGKVSTRKLKEMRYTPTWEA